MLDGRCRAPAAPQRQPHPPRTITLPATAPALRRPTEDFDDDTDRDDRADWRDRIESHRRRNSQHHADGDVVSIGHSSHLESGQKADSVVSVFGSSTSDGEAVDVVSVIGNTRVTGPVGDTAVAVMGNAYVDAKVNGDVVAVLGNVELGPNAEVGRRRGCGLGHGEARSRRGRARLGAKDHRLGYWRRHGIQRAQHLDHPLFAVGPPLGVHGGTRLGVDTGPLCFWRFTPASR